MRLASPCIVYCIFKSYLTPTPKDYCNLSIYHHNMCRYLFSYKKKSEENENDDIPIKKPL